LKKTIIIVLLVLNILITQYASAHVFRITSNKTTYTPEDEIIIKLEVKNTQTFKNKFDVYMRITEENSRSPPLFKYYPITLLPDESTNITYRTNVSEYMVNGNYTVHAYILEDGFITYEDTKRFSITGLPEIMDVEILLSNKSDFSILKDVFLTTQRIYIGYRASTGGINVRCTLTHPDNSSEDIIIPCSIICNQTGLYSLDITAEKQGYRNITKTMQFAVIEKTIYHEEEAKLTETHIITHHIEITIIIIMIIIIIILILSRKRSQMR